MMVEAELSETTLAQLTRGVQEANGLSLSKP